MNTRSVGWQPPHCPNPDCKYHNDLHEDWPYRKHGFFYRRTHPQRIQRFTCLNCGRAFSTQTFSTTYWLKRPDILPALLMKVVGGMCNRQIARDLQTSPTTIDHQLSRLGRHCLLHHRQRLRNAPPPGDLAIDGFESYERSQYQPFHFHIAVEPETSFINHFTDSELRRKGRMTEVQRERRRQLEALHGRPDPKAVQKDVTELLQTVLEGAERTTLRSDKHQAYPRAIRRVNCEVRHVTVSSRDRRDQHNLLWEINRLDRMIRHSQAGHARETLAAPKRRQRAAERLAIFTNWWNYMRARWVRGTRASPGMLRGLTRRLMSVKEILGGRIFRSRAELPPRWEQYYNGSVRTRVMAVNRGHELTYAY